MVTSRSHIDQICVGDKFSRVKALPREASSEWLLAAFVTVADDLEVV